MIDEIFLKDLLGLTGIQRRYPTALESKEILKLALLGLWARDHGIPALVHMVLDIKQTDGTCPHKTFPDGERAVNEIPPDTGREG